MHYCVCMGYTDVSKGLFYACYSGCKLSQMMFTNCQVQIQIKVPDHDPLLEVKLEVLQSHCLPRARDVNGFKSSNDSFTIKLVASTLFCISLFDIQIAY